MPRPQWIRYETGKTVPGADILANICRIHAVSADWLLGLDQKPPSAITINGNMNAVAQGPGARAVSTSKLPPGELPQCAKCEYRHLAEKARKMFGGK